VPSDRDSWIVLLNKSPHGPFTEDIIKVLLEQGVVRINDVAFKVPQGEDKSHSEWKFLWQFSEFDRRLGRENRDEKTPPAPIITPAEAERRKAASELEAKRKVESTLPVDLINISPEELIVRSSQHHPTHARHHEAPVEINLPRESEGSRRFESKNNFWALGAGFMVIVVATTMILFRRNPGVPAMPPSPVVDSAPDPRTPATSSRGPLDGAIAPRRPTQLPQQAPRARERDRDRVEVEDPHVSEPEDIDEGDEGLPPAKDREPAEDNEDNEGRVLEAPAFKRGGMKPKRAKGWEGAADEEGRGDEGPPPEPDEEPLD